MARIIAAIMTIAVSILFLCTGRQTDADRHRSVVPTKADVAIDRGTSVVNGEEHSGRIEACVEKLVSDAIINAVGQTKSPLPMVPRNLVAFCFAPNTPDSVMAELRTRTGIGQERFYQVPRWSATATNANTGNAGDPIVLTYSFPPDGTAIPMIQGVSFPAGINNFRAWINGIYGSEAQWLPLFQATFDRWSELCGITFVYEPNDDGATMNFNPGILGVRGDLRIGGKALDGDSGVLAYNNFPDDGDMVFDTSDNYYDDTSSQSIRLRNIIAHEHGHGMGLLHSCPLSNSKLMEPFISIAFDGPQHDDILGAQSHYGDPFEPNDSTATATILGSLVLGVETSIGDLPPPSTNSASRLSIDDNGDSDYFRISVPERSFLSIQVESVGLLYLNGPQQCGGETASCCPGVNTNSLESADLTLELLASDGATSLVQSDVFGPGGTETADWLADAGDFFIQVAESDVPAAPQFYRLSVTATALPSVAFNFPQGVPSTLQLGETNEFDIQIITDETIVPTSPTVYVRVNGGPFQSTSLTPTGGEFFSFQLPAENCADLVDFYFRVETVESGIVYFPLTAPTTPYTSEVVSNPDCLDSILIPIPERRDHIYDPVRDVLYISTTAGNIERWDVASGAALPAIDMGGDLRGIDITDDGNALYVADLTVFLGNASVRKLDLNSLSVSNLVFPVDGGQLGAWDVSIGLNGRALVTAEYSGSGNTPLRTFVVGEDVISDRTDILNVNERTTLRRSGDRRRILLLQANSSGGPVNIYDAEHDTLSRELSSGISLSNSVSSISHDGKHIALDLFNEQRITRETLATEAVLTNYDGGLYYDLTEDLLYAVDDAADQLAVLNANTNEELYRIDIDEDVGASGVFGSGEMSVSSDRQWLFLSTQAGIRQIRLAQPESRLLIVRDAPPLFVHANQSIELGVKILSQNDTLVAGSPEIHYRTDDGAYQTSTLAETGQGEFLAELPGLSCGESIEYYFSAQGALAGVVTFPLNGAGNPLIIGPNDVADCGGSVSIPLSTQTDAVHDGIRNRMYFTTVTGFVEVLDLDAGRMLDAIPVGASLSNLDITADGQYLYICESWKLIDGDGLIYKVDIDSSNVTQIIFPTIGSESNPVDIAVLSSGKAIFSTNYVGSGSVWLHEIDLATDQESARFDIQTVGERSRLARSVDGMTLLIAEGNSSEGAINIFDADADAIVADDALGSNLTNSRITVSRDGDSVAVAVGSDLAVRTRSLATVADLSVAGGGIAFDPTRDLLYRCDGDTDEIFIHMSSDLTPIAALPAGGNLPAAEGDLYITNDGSILFASAGSGIQMVGVPTSDCNDNGVDDLTEVAEGSVANCNDNTLPDLCELSIDCNVNMVPDECEVDCNRNGITDECDIASGESADCDGDGQPDECQIDNNDIDLWLSQLSASHPDFTALIPSRFDFVDGDVGNRIFDGGDDMYDNGNRLNTNLKSSLLYTNNLVVSGDSVFGPGSSYFTAKFDGIFVLAAQQMDISFFRVTGYLGADGAGFVDDATIPILINEVEFTLLMKRVWGAGDPSVNHLVIVPGNAAGISHTYSSSTNDDLDTYSGLGNIDRLFYILVAREMGLYLDDATATAIATEFIERLELAGFDCNANGIFDACEADCNNNGFPDDCDIADGSSVDLDGNGIPDECLAFDAGDMNCDATLDIQDIPPFIDALISSVGFAGCDINLADMNNDGIRDGLDLSLFVEELLGS